MMERHAFKMKLHPGMEAEYRKRHDEIWPELARELRSAGVSDYSIFLDEETLTLFEPLLSLQVGLTKKTRTLMVERTLPSQ